MLLVQEFAGRKSESSIPKRRLRYWRRSLLGLHGRQSTQIWGAGCGVSVLL